MNSTQILKEEFLRRKERNQRYSIRSFARDLGVSHALISQIFSGKSLVTAKQAVRMSGLLSLPTRMAQQFLETSIFGTEKSKLSNPASFFDSEVEYELVVSRWFHAAILEMTYLKEFKADSSWIAQKLGITNFEASDAIERLKKLGLLEAVGSRLKKTQNFLRFKTTSPKPGLRAFYTTLLRKAVEELTQTSDAAFQSRFIGGSTLAIHTKKIPLARKRLQEMQEEFIKEFAQADADQVYTLNLQFFSLTKTKGETSK